MILRLVLNVTGWAVAVFTVILLTANAQNSWNDRTGIIELPGPQLVGKTSLEECLAARRSVRDFRKNDSLSLEEVSQLLWAAQGITAAGGLRTAPSAGAKRPLELFLVAGNVRSISEGIYHYEPASHQLMLVARGDKRRDLSTAAFDQHSILDAPAVIVFSAVYERTTLKYGDRGKRYVHMETGHAAQNVCLQAVTLKLGTVTIGAFRDEEVKKILSLMNDQEPLYLMPVGRRVNG